MQDKVELSADGFYCGAHPVAQTMEQLKIESMPKAEIQDQIRSLLHRYTKRNGPMNLRHRSPWNAKTFDPKRLSRAFVDLPVSWHAPFSRLDWNNEEHLKWLLCALLNQQRLVKYYQRLGFEVVPNPVGFLTQKLVSSVAAILQSP